MFPLSEKMVHVNSVLEEINQDGSDAPIYYTEIRGAGYISSFLQFLLKDETLYYCPNVQEADLPAEHYLVMYNRIPVELQNDYEIIAKPLNIYLLKKLDSNKESPPHLRSAESKESPPHLRSAESKENITGEVRLPIEIFQHHPGAAVNDNEYIESNGEAGPLIWGPYSTIYSGNYSWTSSLELIASDQEIIGSVSVMNGEEQLAEIILQRSDFDSEGKLLVDLNTTLTETKEKVEFRVSAESNVILRVYDVAVKGIAD